MAKPTAYAKAEWDRPTFVFTHEPGIEAFLANFFPAGGLNQGPASIVEASAEHKNMVQAIEEHVPGVIVKDVKDLLVEQAKVSKETRYLLQSLADDAIKLVNQGLEMKDWAFAKQEKRYALRLFTERELVEACMLSPKVDCQYSEGRMNTGFSEKIIMRPLNNLIFLRDQQMTTDKGIVMGNLNSEQRRFEKNLTHLVFHALGSDPVFAVSETGRMEGGDFIPAGDFALQGVGLRTNFEAVEQMLENGVYGYEEVAIVYDKEGNQDAMHLDTYLNLASREKAVVLEDKIQGDFSRKEEALVSVYHKKDDGSYEVSNEAVFSPEHEKIRGPYGKTFHLLKDYLEVKGVEVVCVSKEEQLSYATNFLTIAPNKVIGIDIRAKQEMRNRMLMLEKCEGQQDFFPVRQVNGDLIDYQKMGDEFMGRMEKAGITYIPVPLNHLNMLYGGIHCGTQVFREEK